MDWYVTLITNGELKCDMDGKMGRKGEINQPLLTDLLSHPYLSQKPPKSTGTLYSILIIFHLITLV